MVAVTGPPKSILDPDSVVGKDLDTQDVEPGFFEYAPGFGSR